MTPDGLPSGHDLSAWHRRFPDHRLWAGRLRLWRVELATPSPDKPLLAEWIDRAAPDRATAARRLGLPAAAHANDGDGLSRETFALLDLPGGCQRVSPPSVVFEPWPEPVGSVPADVLRPAGVDCVPFSGDWRTVPLVRAEAADVVAVRVGNGIQVFAAGAPEAAPLWELSGDALGADI